MFIGNHKMYCLYHSINEVWTSCNKSIKRKRDKRKGYISQAVLKEREEGERHKKRSKVVSTLITATYRLKTKITSSIAIQLLNTITDALIPFQTKNRYFKHTLVPTKLPCSLGCLLFLR